MTDKNTTNETTTTPGTELPPVPNGHGTSNGTAPHDAAATAEAAPTTSQPSSKKKKKRDAHAQRTVIATIDPAAVPVTASAETPQPPQSSEPAVQDTAAGPSTPSTPTGQPVPIETPAASAAPAPPAPIEPPPVAPAAAAPAPPAAAPIGETAAKGLRLRMKIWTDARTNKRYLVPSAFMRDVVDGHPVSDVMYAYALSGDEILHITLRANEWQMLPFAFFQEEGPA